MAGSKLKEDGRSGKPVIAGFVLLLIAGAATILAARASANAEWWTSHTLEVRQTVERLFSEIQDAETGQRGFLLTADPTYLNPFNEAKRQIPATKDQLRLLTRDNAEHQTRLDKLYPLIDQKLAELERTVVLAQSADLAGATAIVKTNAGRDLMTAIRAVMSDFDAAEVRLQDARIAKAAFQRSILLSLILARCCSSEFWAFSSCVVRAHTRVVWR